MSRIARRQFKICIAGEGNVGKTSIRRKYLDKTFKGNYIPTLGVDFAQKTIEFEGERTNLVIWDIAGQPLYQSLRRRYYEGASGIIIAYSVVDRDSFNDASKWLVEAHRFMLKLPPLMIMGNKIDLREAASHENPVTTDEGVAFSKKISQELGTPTIFFETSALTGENINEAFHALTTMMVKKLKKSGPAPQPLIHLPGSTTPTDATEKFIRETEQIGVPVTSDASSSIETKSSAVASASPEVAPISTTVREGEAQDAEETHEPLSELGGLRRELKRTETERDAALSDLDTILLKLRNEIQVKKIMYEHLMQQVSLTKNEWAVAYDAYMVTVKSKKGELERWAKEIDGIMKKIDKIGKKL